MGYNLPMLSEKLDAVLTKVKPKLLLEEVSPNPHPEIAALYKSDNAIKQFCGTLINAIALKGSKHFSVSYRVFIKLLEKDASAEHKTLSGAQYKAMLKAMYDAELMTQVTAPSERGKGRRIGIYEIRADILSLKPFT